MYPKKVLAKWVLGDVLKAAEDFKGNFFINYFFNSDTLFLIGFFLVHV